MERDLYVALGDSITAGYGATHPSLSFVHQVSDHTRGAHLAKATTVLAQNGWDTHTLYRAVRISTPALWQRTNVLTVLTGGNDLRKLLRRQYLSLSGSPLSPHLISLRLQRFAYDLDVLAHFLSTQDIPRVLLGTVYNPVPHSPLATQAIEELNVIIRRTAERHRLELIDIYSAFKGKEPYLIHGYRTGRIEDLAVLTRRPIHPNNEGHRTIASLTIKRLINAHQTLRPLTSRPQISHPKSMNLSKKKRG